MNNKNKICVITDIHGCYETFVALLSKIPEEYEIVLAGDLVDRGPRSDLVLIHAKQANYKCVLGNHEHMMLYWSGQIESQYYQDRSIWLYNGGAIGMPMFQESSGRLKIPNDILVWVNRLPLYIDIGNVRISHTGYGEIALHSDKFFDKNVWLRYGHDNVNSDMSVIPFPDDGLFRVFGHTPKKEPWLEKNFAMIDTGCAHKNRGMGKLTAYLLPEKTIIQQECIDKF